MYARRNTLGRYGKPTQPRVEAYTFPASVGGMNGVDSLMMMPPEDCLYTYNLMPSEYGQRLRKGYREWATGCVEDPPRAEFPDVRTIIPFESNIQDPANDRMFAVTAEGIWNVTLFNTINPFQEAVFTQDANPSGFGVWTEFTGDAAGDGLRGHYLFYADGLNGLWRYEEAIDSWAQPPADGGTGDISDPPAAGALYFRNLAVTDVTSLTYYLPFPVDNIAFVTVHKQRIWVILEDEDDAWYFPIASVSGELKRFTYGSKMPHGGNLMGLWNWTIDGGDGVDDMLVAIGRGGDVIVYQGEDPEITPDGSSQGPWSTRGTWFVGETPNSRRIVAKYGPDMFILSTFGVTSLNDLLRGAPLGGQTPSKKINRFLRRDVENAKDESSWQMVVHPADGFMQIITPKPSQTPFIQYNQNLQTNAWGFWEGVPIFGADSWTGDYFMGGANGVVFINDGVLDGTEIAKANFFQDVPAAVGVGWTVPLPLEFQCDGTQVAETEYTVTLTEALVIGQAYTAFYRIKPNALINFWQNVPNPAPGAEWTVPIAGSYACDGTQGVETEYRVDAVIPLKAGIRLEIVLTMTENSSGNYKVRVGNEDVFVFQGGNGQYSFTFTPTVDATTLALVGTGFFIGTFTQVVVVYFDGAGFHSLDVGATKIASPKRGSGAYQANFIATAAYTELSLVGDEDFTGTFTEVGLRVQSFEGEAVAFRALSSFQAPKGHSNFTRVGFIRTIGVLAGAASLNVKAVYDYSIEQQVTPPVQVPVAGQNIWDSAVWDTDLWDFAIEGQSFTSGTLGLGRVFAVAVNGNANTRINIVGWDVLFEQGGFL